MSIKKILCTLFAIAMLSIPCSIFTYADNEIDQSGEVVFQTVMIGEESVIVPCVVKTTSQGIVARGGTETVVEDDITYYLPVTDEAKEYNARFVSSSRSSGVATDTFPDPKNYMIATSSIRYTISGGYISGKYCDDLYIQIDNVALTRNKDPESSTGGGILWGIGNPTADRIVCVGATSADEYNPGTMNQVAYNVPMTWSSSGVNTPSSWKNVVRGKYSDYYRGLVEYSYTLVYNTGSVDCEISHTLAK